MTPASKSDTRILVVEDEFLIALDIKRMLQDFGYRNIAMAPTVSRALDVIAGTPPDFAVLDINLGPEYSVKVSDELRKRRIPYIICSAYTFNADLMYPHDPDVSLVRKPVRREDLYNAISQTLAAQ